MRVLSSAAVLAALLAPAASASPIERPALSRDGVEAALSRLKAQSPKLRARWREGKTVPSMLLGLKVHTSGPTLEARALDFVSRHQALVGTPTAQLKLVPERGITELPDGRKVLRFEQRFNGLPVVDKELVLTLNAASEVVAVNNGAETLREVTPTRVTEIQARQAALEAVLSQAGSSLDLPNTIRKVIYVGPERAVEGFEVSVIALPGKAHYLVRVDEKGAVFGLRNTVLR